MKNVKKFKQLIILISFGLSGCGWVDSTGSQTESGQALSTTTINSVGFDDAFSVLENSRSTLVFSSGASSLSGWTWEPLDGQASIDSCTQFDGFQRELVTNELALSCASGQDCQVRIQESSINGITQFDITTPNLRSPAALEYRVSTTDTTGNYIETRQTLCALSINEAPTAVDDQYTVTRGEFLRVRGNDLNGLLNNDFDDIDVRNEPLRVNTAAVQSPRFASEFTLYEDGGFDYRANANAPLTVNGSISDSFTYSVTDGTHTMLATVVIRLVEFNSTAMLVGEIPGLSLFLDKPLSNPLLLDFNEFFADQQGDTLSFRLLPGSLPDSGNLFLTTSGQLFGQPSSEDVGEYDAILAVFDGVEEITETFSFSIAERSEPNRLPGVTDISNRTVSGNFSYDVSVFFNDVNGDTLSFTAINLPNGVSISQAGVISGISSAANRGRWLIRVTADDGNGGTVDDGFRLTIR